MKRTYVCLLFCLQIICATQNEADNETKNKNRRIKRNPIKKLPIINNELISSHAPFESPLPIIKFNPFTNNFSPLTQSDKKLLSESPHKTEEGKNRLFLEALAEGRFKRKKTEDSEIYQNSIINTLLNFDEPDEIV